MPHAVKWQARTEENGSSVSLFHLLEKKGEAAKWLFKRGGMG
jgi:hypothetical protein